MPALLELGDAHDVPRGLRDLLPGEPEVAAVHPDRARPGGRPRPRSARSRPRGGGTAVDAAGVDVEPIAQVLHRHRRALDVPAGEALAPRRVPLHQPAGPGRLPQGEVGRVRLRLIGLEVPVAFAEVVERVPAELPVAGERRHVVVHAARCRRRRRGPGRSGSRVSAIISGMCSVAFGYRSAGRIPSAAASSNTAWVYFSAISSGDRPSSSIGEQHLVDRLGARSRRSCVRRR